MYPRSRRTDIVHDDILELEFRVHVVDLDGNKYTYDVKPSTEVGEVIGLVAGDTGLAPDAIRLKEEKNEDKLNDDQATLYISGVLHEDVLVMYEMTIYVVTPGGDKYTFPVTPITTIDDLIDQVSAATGIPKDEIDLVDEDGGCY